MNIKEITTIVFAIGLFFLYYKIMRYFRSKSIKKNINSKVTIIIEGESTVLIGANNQQIFKIKPNTMVYKRQKRGKYKIISFGSITKSLDLKINSSGKSYYAVDFIRNIEQIEQMNHFWFNYITYLSLKAKECIGMSKLAIPSLELRVEHRFSRIQRRPYGTGIHFQIINDYPEITTRYNLFNDPPSIERLILFDVKSSI